MRPYSLNFAHATLFVALIGVVDYLTGYQISFGVFYLLPIGLLSWSGGLRQGVLLACLSAITWFVADIFSGATYDNPFIPYWNAVTRLGIFVTVAMLVGRRSRETGTVEARKEELEMLVEERTAAIRESEMQYRDLFESATYGIFRATLDGRFLDVNPALVQMLGYDSKADLMVVDIPHGIYRDSAARALLVEEIKRMGRYGDTEVEWKRKDGRVITVRLNGRIQRNRHGGPVAAECFVEDVTERRSMEQQLRQSQKMEAVGRLAGGVAHDFNNLLGVIIGYAELATMRIGDQEPLRQQIEEIHKAGQRAASLTRQLLAFSRQQVLEPRILNLNHVVEDLTKMLQRLIGEHIELSTSLDPGLGSVKADPGQVEQVLMNLVVNARDAMPDGGRLTIETRNVELDDSYAQRKHPVTPGRYAMLAVSDTGVGMDKETQSHMFEPFFTTKEKGKGTGLGLATVYGIVKQSGGYIWVYSEPGQGTTFKVYLPRVDEPAAEDQARTTEADSFRGTETILVVEDEAALRAVTCEFLRQAGYAVLSANDGFEALQVCRQHQGPIHALVTDVVMPQMGGAELARNLRAERPQLSVLYVSGYTDETLEYQKVLEEGQFLLCKPFTREELYRKLRQALQARM